MMKFSHLKKCATNLQVLRFFFLNVFGDPGGDMLPCSQRAVCLGYMSHVSFVNFRPVCIEYFEAQ